MYKFILFICIIAISACQSSDPSIPSGVIGETEMVQIIKDMQLMESVHKDIGVYGLEKKAISDTSFMVVFNHHNIKPSEFDSSMKFYSRYPKMMERIMENVVTELNKEI